jgi:hypothetical protein
VALGTGPHQGRVRGTSYLGKTVEYLLETPAGPVKAEVPMRRRPGMRQRRSPSTCRWQPPP